MDHSLDQQIQEELSKWKNLGIEDPAKSVTSNSFIDSVKIMALSNLLVEKEIITQEEAEEAFKKQMLVALAEARAGLNAARMHHLTKGITH